MRAIAATIGVMLGMAALAGPAQAMQFHRVLLADNNLAISGVGEIVDGDAARLMSLIRDMMVAAPSDHIMGFMLDSPGGQLAEGVKLATMIQAAQLPVVVGPGATCASACFLLFAAGSSRIVAPDALIGVHSASEAGQENTDSMATTTAMARAAADLGVPPQIIGKMVETTPNRMAWLTRDDLALMDVKIIAPTQQAAAPPAPAPSPPPAEVGIVQPPTPVLRLGPSYDCSRADTQVTKFICSDADLSRADLLLVQPYYVLRQIVGPTGWKPMMVEAINFQQTAQQACGIDQNGNIDIDQNGNLVSPDLSAVKACLMREYLAQRNVWMARLTGAGLQEAMRPLEQHVVLQAKLKALGYLPASSIPDGIYGTGTRTAIINWQQAVGLLPTGLLGDADAVQLMNAP